MNEKEINDNPPVAPDAQPDGEDINQQAEAPDTVTSTEPDTSESPDISEAEPTEAPVDSTLSGEPTTPTEPSPLEEQSQTVIASETPAAEPAKKSKAPLISLVAILVVAILGVGAYFLLPLLNKTSAPGQDNPAHNNQANNEVSEIEYGELTLRGNDLSDFDLSFLKLEAEEDKNVIYSPLSIKYALAMLKDGAAGESKTQIANLIGDYQPKFYLNNEHRSLANGMFVKDFYKPAVLDDYTNMIKERYNADLIVDPFLTAEPINSWVSDKTLGIIDSLLTDGEANDLRFMLVNALAIDMNWNNQLQCAGGPLSCKYYSVRYAHEKYSDSIKTPIWSEDDFEKITFNGIENSTPAAQVRVSANRYDIITDKGEDTIRNVVQEEYTKDLGEAPSEEYLNGYMESLSSNYGKLTDSTDFLYNLTDSEKVFVKDLQEYDGSTLQYVAIMPKDTSLNSYIESLTANKISTLVSNLTDPSSIESYKEGVITKLVADIPFFKFSYDMGKDQHFMINLRKLGINEVFDPSNADLSGMLNVNYDSENRPFINYASHKADIDFSNDGIKAAAVTAVGGMGGGGDWDYLWDVPVEEIDLTFDKPFLFLIRDKGTGEVWFVGTVYNPTAE